MRASNSPYPTGGVREKRAERGKTTQFKQKFDFVNHKMDVFHAHVHCPAMSIYSWCVNNI